MYLFLTSATYITIKVISRGFPVVPLVAFAVFTYVEDDTDPTK